MNKIITLSDLASALGKKTNVTHWEKGGKKRLYFNGAGYRTKKMTTSAFIDLSNDKATAVVCIECPSQPSAWIKSQEAEVAAHLEKYVRYCNRFFDFGTSGQPVEVVMNNAILAAEPVRGYYTEWRAVRVSINRFGKLADRNRQFVVPFKGTKDSAPRGFVPLSHKVFAYLKERGEQMMEPYTQVPDYDERAEAYATYQQCEQQRLEKEAADKIVAEQKKEAKMAGLAKAAREDIESMTSQGVSLLAAWKAAGCVHPAPAEVVEAKKASGLNWNQFIASIK